MARERASIKLPSLVSGTADVARLRRELEALYDYLHQAALRQQKSDDIKLPKTSRALDELTKLNDLDLMQREHYDQLVAEMDLVYESSPRIHISFASDPSASFRAKITEWLRSNIDPTLLVQIGLQPSIAAGCVVRTTNKQFDMSLRRRFDSARPVLLQKLNGQEEAA